MNLAAVSLLRDQPENRPWYRVASTSYLTAAIATAHTVVTPSRFYDPYSANPQFTTLYLSDGSLVAMFEAQALFGSPTTLDGPFLHQRVRGTAPVTDLVIRVPCGWTAIDSGLSPIRSLADGKTYNFRWTAVYVRIGEGWQIAASQATRLPEAK